MDLVADILAAKPRAISRMITLIERRDALVPKSMKALYKRCGRAKVVGVTGAPGAGKSCLVAALIRALRKRDLSVGVLAVDPSSPFTGGAILGDRDRMADFGKDPKVFIRSLATRGASGGLCEAVNASVDVLDAAGKDVIIIETVGVGQNEIDIVKLAHSVILVLVPGYGDSLQAMKAGIMEIADVMVINKADLPGAAAVYEEMCGLPQCISAGEVFEQADQCQDGWRVPVIKAVALRGTGIDELASLVDMHYRFLSASQELTERSRTRRVSQFMDILTRQIRSELVDKTRTDSALRHWLERIERLEIDPYQASGQVVEHINLSRNTHQENRHER